MRTNSLNLFAIALGVTLIGQFCTVPVYAQDTPPPPPPVYTQPPPPAPQDYVQPAPTDQAYTPAPQQQETPLPPQQQAPAPITYQTFYDELSPYGQWVYTIDYGNVWVPYAGDQFQPYGTAGHWVLTNYGWTWASDYPWGWAPFHYGRWESDPFMGWYWIPGYEWSPAWVSWRTTPGYYGWAPLGPTYVYGSYATYNCPPQRYVFVNAAYINSPTVYTYYEPRNQCVTYYNRSAVITNTYYDRSSNSTYYAGPQSREVERYTGTPVRQVNVVSASSPDRANANGNQVAIFRPSVQQPNPNDAAKPAPTRVYQKSEMASIAQRPVLTQANQARVAPFKPESVQPVAQPNKQQMPPAAQHQPIQEQHQAIPQQQPKPMQPQQPAPQQPRQQIQQQPTPQQQRAPVQQQARQQPAPQPRQQQATARQQQPKQQRQQPKQQKPAKQQYRNNSQQKQKQQ